MDTAIFEGIKFRWLNDACYEIELPTGAHILIDPYIDHSENSTLTVQAIKRADYVLISHTHFDHVLELGDIFERFAPKIYVGAQSALELARYYRLPADKVTPCWPGGAFDTPDFTLEVFQGKHVPLGDWNNPSGWKGFGEENQLPPEIEALNVCGSFEYCNYRITTPNNQRLLVWGGEADYHACRQMAGVGSDLAILQFGRNPEQAITDFCAAIHPQLIVPHHHELIQGTGYIERVEGLLAKQAPFTTVLDIQKGVWYRFGSMAALAGEG